MQEGSPPTSEAPSADTEVTPPEQPTTEAEGEVTSESRTVEEVEAIWKNRVAGKDRAHAAEANALRRQIEELQGRRSTEAGDEGTDNEWKNRYEESEKTRAEEARRHAVDVRSIRYAAAAEALDDPDALASMDEGKLAALNARLTGREEEPPPPPIDPNASRRPAPTTAAPRDRSIEELEADLKRLGPAYSESLNQ